MILVAFFTLTSILSLGEGEEEKIRMWMLVSTFSAPTQGFSSVCLKLNDGVFSVSTLTSILSLREGEEEKIRISMHAPVE
jgi:hypothetical protein